MAKGNPKRLAAGKQAAKMAGLLTRYMNANGIPGGALKLPERMQSFISARSLTPPGALDKRNLLIWLHEHVMAVAPSFPKRRPADKTKAMYFAAAKGATPAAPIDRYKEFYASWEWSQVRYAALQKYGATCSCCGATKQSGAKIVMDHIKPIRLFWELRLDIDNLQPLCDPCNMGKSFRDTTDWRAGQAVAAP